MVVIRLDGPADPRATDYRNLTDVGLRRRLEPERGLFLAEGHQVIGRALEANFGLRSVLTTPRWLPAVQELALTDDAMIYVADEAMVNDITGYRVHRGALAAMERKPLPALTSLLTATRRLVVLEGVVDHTNVGAAFRSVAAFGFDGIVIDPTCADPLYRRAVRVSMGAVLTLAWTRCDSWPDDMDTLADSGFTMVALTPGTEAEPLAEVVREKPDKIALLLGTEGAGLTPTAMGRAQRRVRIPMAGAVDSLNIAAAAAVACYAFRADKSTTGENS